MHTNELGQVTGQKCSHCGRPSTQCVGRCKACGTDALWHGAERLYRCDCGQAVLKAAPLCADRPTLMIVSDNADECLDLTGLARMIH